MNVGLFVPCYVDTYFPETGISSLRLLERLGCKVDYPTQQTCCGQPMANSGCSNDAVGAARHFVKTFNDYDYIVTPSGSCAAMVRHQYPDLLEGDADVGALAARTYELSEFLTDIVEVKALDVSCPRRAVFHEACHGLRGLRLGRGSERPSLPEMSKPRSLLRMVQGLELRELDRPDECCGFGGTFAVKEPEVSVRMGTDKLDDASRSGADLVISTDMSCLMHLSGLSSRKNAGFTFVHISQVLNGDVS